jgi:hypothetical protein
MQIRITTAAVLASLLLAGGALATTPGPGQHFDCSDGGDSSCAADDEGCVPADSLSYKCSSLAAKMIAKAVKGAFSCHAKQAQMRFQGSSENGAGNSEENCEDNPGNSVKSKFDDGVAKLTSLNCGATFISGVTTLEATLFGSGPGSFDGDNANAYCQDSVSQALIGDDDTGWVALNPGNLKCEISVAKGLAALRVNVIKCHRKMGTSFFKGVDFAEEDCEEVSSAGKGALAKFNALRDKLVGANICPNCLSASTMDSLAASTISTEDANNDIAFPCP